ncbi:MAG: hypothetical protein JNM56_11165 [Planctomycetia bacterium]|nr:hypothetical protein [Planctomycetia bacterium]
MYTTIRQALAASIVGLIALSWTAVAPAQAVFRSAPQGYYGVPGRTQTIVRPVAVPVGGGFNYSPFYGADPYGGYLRGTADVINAQGNYLMQVEQAYMASEQVKQAKLDTRRKRLDEYLYEKSVLPTLEQQRDEEQRQQYLRSRNNPPQTEIWSGKALNDLLLAIVKTQTDTGLHGPAVPLDYEMLPHLNFTSGAPGTTDNNASMLRDGGKLRWPFPLQRPAFTKQRAEIDKLTAQAVKMTIDGNLDFQTLDGLSKNVDQLRRDLKANVADMGANEYIQSVKYVNQLSDNVKLLSQPNAANYLNGKWEAKAVSVGELIEQMTKQGLRFAPAAAGDESYYNSLHRSLADYDAGLARLVRR